jgi:hypothetical protein
VNSRRDFIRKLARAAGAAFAAPIVVGPLVAECVPTPVLNLDEVFSKVYAVRQARRLNSRYIDVLTDRETAFELERSLLRYYKEQYG